MTKQKQMRGAVRKSSSRLIAVWLPTHLADAVDRAVVTFDTDRSKFIREAIREHTRRKANP